jgi:endonuclease/exonuclease/phosphatase family metal-dependent hydrolase
MEIRVLSLNCWGVNQDASRLGAIAKELLLHEADIIALQEVVFGWQVQLMAERLDSDYYIFGPPKRFGVLNHGGLLLAVKKKYSVQASFTSFLRQSPRFHPLGWSDALLGKGWQRASISCEGVEFIVFNTHTLGAYRLFKERERMVIAQQFQELEQAVLGGGQNFVLCGDLNRSPASLENSFLSEIAEALGLLSGHVTVDNLGNPLRQGRLAKISGRGKHRPNQRLDYIFAEGYEFVSSEVAFDTPYVTREYEGYLSDHFGVAATLRRWSG